ncbi:S8 family serine peptidase [Winogradskyella arenosi]|uniref:Putative secreted protein (Por secretion system target) n=1 Tax=Winogradskyella arenosi TaxID=533325 RepID=A0A368ZNM2_9FLAO|nr:S8 family serine peptidase [Winogradskyella arenosi]RCW94156.1 putative secreted protein (Por secretion system target) [Winogradskyella arenosi]
MKKYLLSIALLVAFNQSYSQNPADSKLSQGNLQLLEQFKLEETNRLARIDSYLKAHPETKVSFKDGFNYSHIYDVVDGVVLYKSTDNLDAGRATKTSYLQVGGQLNLDLDGSGMTVGVWDGGPAQNTHVEFLNTEGTNSRITVIDNITTEGESAFSSHGTHVVGTIAAIGVDPRAKGMATNVSVKSYNWTNDLSEMVSAVNASSNPIILSNHSYGIPVIGDDGALPSWYMGAYTQDAASIDNIALNNPKYLIVASAGNSGQSSYEGGLYPGYDKLTTDKNAKNSLIIANASPVLAPFTYDLEPVSINSSSSQGPTDDLRIKPDIAADGTGLLSTVPTDSYAEMTGTSMSAPNTTGTLVLLQQYYNQLNGEYMDSSTLRGLVSHTAVDDFSEEGPDPKFGWGFLDAKVSAETILAASTGEAIMDELNLMQNETYTLTFSAEAGDILKASICWIDQVGPVSTGELNDPTARLVNDLDLRLSKDGSTFMPWKLNYSADSGFSNSKGDNSADNIEIIEIEAPSSGVYSLTVSHKGTLKGNVGGPFDPQSQDFSLIVTGNNLTLGVEENALSNSLVVYPNPNKGEFTISFDSNLATTSDVVIDIYDISGRKVYQNTFANVNGQFNKTINLTGVASGVYVANIAQGANKTSQKIIIE